MGRNSAGVRAGTNDGSGQYKGKISNEGSLVEMKDKAMYKATKQAISRYHAVMGVRQRNVKLADLDGSAYGVHVTRGGQSEAVYLNRKHFDTGAKNVHKEHANNYKTGWSTKTNKPVAHTVTHELAHATWNAHMTGPNQRAAGKEIEKLYKKWSNDKRKKGYGKYAETNVSEFWAETVTKAVHGKSDKYTRTVKDIAKKYKL